jgi:hypothetical protein
MKKLVLAVTAVVIAASPALAAKKHSHRHGAQGLYMQSSPDMRSAPYGFGAPSSPAVMSRGKANTDTDPFIYYYLIRSYREEGLG